LYKEHEKHYTKLQVFQVCKICWPMWRAFFDKSELRAPRGAEPTSADACSERYVLCNFRIHK